MSELANRAPVNLQPNRPKYAQDADREYVGEPWERQPNETVKSFDAFTKYLQLGNDRSIAEAVRQYPELGRKESFYRWSAQHRWIERAEAWDALQDARKLSRMKRAKLHAAERQARQSAELQEVLTRPMDKLRERIAEVLDGERPDWLDSLNDADLTKLVAAFGAELPKHQKAERDAYDSVSDVPVRDTKRKVHGQILRRVLADKSLVGMVEQVQFEVDDEPIEEAE